MHHLERDRRGRAGCPGPGRPWPCRPGRSGPRRGSARRAACPTRGSCSVVSTPVSLRAFRPRRGPDRPKPMRPCRAAVRRARSAVAIGSPASPPRCRAGHGSGGPGQRRAVPGRGRRPCRRGGRLGVVAARDAARRPGQPARRHRVPHRRRPSGPGRCARVTAEASITASQPSSIASAASLAVPMPASRITGTAAALDDQLEVVRVADAEPRADRRAERHDRRAARRPPACRASTGSSLVYGSTVKPSSTSVSAASSSLDRVGQQGPLVGDDLQLDPVGAERLAGQPGGQHGLARGEAARRVRQHPDAAPAQHVEHRAAGARVEPPHRDRGQLGAGRDQRLRPAPPGWARRPCP